jgi:hypothetical protein
VIVLAGSPFVEDGSETNKITDAGYGDEEDEGHAILDRLLPSELETKQMSVIRT